MSEGAEIEQREDSKCHQVSKPGQTLKYEKNLQTIPESPRKGNRLRRGECLTLSKAADVCIPVK